MNNIELIFNSLIIIFLVFATIINFLKSSKTSKEKAELQVKELAISLFLMAEKTGIIGADKMKYVVEKFHYMIPLDLLHFILEDEDDLESYLQKLYDSVKDKVVNH